MQSLHPDGPSLRRLQEWMAARILGPAAAELLDPGATLDEWLRVPTPARTAERLDVYRGGYPARIHDALAETYPAVAHFAGADAFHALTHRYAASVPLTSYNLNDAGAEMPAFLRRDPLADDLPFLADLGALEWRVAQAFHAAERPPLDPRTLGWSMDEWAHAVLQFQPAVAVVSSAWPLLDLWAARDETFQPIDCARRERPEHVVVRRVDLTVRCESIPAEEALALGLLLAGQSLLDTAERLAGEGHDANAVLASFSRWTSAGMIAGASAG